MTHRCSIIASRQLAKPSAISHQLSAGEVAIISASPRPRVPATHCSPSAFGVPRTAPRAFSLVELLVVIGIIALLVGILLPSLKNARIEANRSSVKQLLASIDRGLEVFSTDFKQYPNSSWRPDPLKLFSAETNPVYLNGAHWLARAMVGHDGQGLDYGARSLEGAAATYDVSAPADNPFIEGRVYSQRRGTYIQKATFDPDDNVGNTADVNGKTGRIVLKDFFGYPILYYRVNGRATMPFSYDGGNNGAPQGAPNDVPGKYNLWDNARITGAYAANTQEPSTYTQSSTFTGWDLGVGVPHGLGVFGNIKNPKDRSASVSPASPPPVGRYFTDFLSDGNALKLGVVKPVNETTCLLISAGPDGLFGTPDDVTNFK